uniref:Shootin 2 n=1 Tax=Cyclopterus lumpus TaxID=8103 RepID=A0A8C2ZJB9_CYCLU
SELEEGENHASSRTLYDDVIEPCVIFIPVTKENKVLKRASQMAMPLILELPEDLAAVTFDPEADPAFNGDEVDDFGEETLLMESQAKIAGETTLLTFFSQLALEVEEKEAILRKMGKQNKTMNKINRVSQLVTEEFTEMSQKLELEQDLRQHAEVFAHQVGEEEPEEKATPAPPPPPPPPPPPLPPLPTAVTKYAKAVDEMMERIKRGIILRPVEKTQRSENRKSAILELKGMLDDRKRLQLRRLPSRRGFRRNVGEAELLQVLHRRRKAMGENQDQTWDPQPGLQCAPAAGGAPWAGESGAAPVLRRLKQNREKRDSRIRASALIINEK